MFEDFFLYLDLHPQGKIGIRIRIRKFTGSGSESALNEFVYETLVFLLAGAQEFTTMDTIVSFNPVLMTQLSHRYP
jgi:hypothetical protein